MGSFITTHASSFFMFDAEFFGKTSNLPGHSAPIQPSFGALQLLAFPKTKITFVREEISDRQWDSGKYDGAADGNSKKGFCRVFWTVEETLGELYWDPKVPILKGTEAPLSYVHSLCLLSSVNVSVFHITWLDVYQLDGRDPFTMSTYIKSTQCTPKISYHFVSYTSIKL